MKLQLLLIYTIVLTIQTANAQSYFDFYHTNIPQKSFDKYSSSFFSANGWLATGNYDAPEGCEGCFGYKKNSKLTKTTLDSLIAVYKKHRPVNIYGKTYVPNEFYFTKDKKSTEPYIVKTVYQMDGNKATALFQTRITFYENPGQQLPGISAIQLFPSQSLKPFDPAIVLTSYKQRLEKDKTDDGPPVIRNQ